MTVADACLLCREAGGTILWQDELCRLVLARDDDYPGFCRVVWKRHVAEMTDLEAFDRRHFMSVVFAAETALRATAGPDKINLASLGNMVPHLHWHIIPRWRDDRHFPNAIWGQVARNDAKHRASADPVALRHAFIQALAEEQGGNS